MAEDEAKKEDKFDFTSAGEASGYISLDQARVLAMRTARETPGAYGRRFRRMPMAFEVVSDEENEDYYVVTLSFRPQGIFAGAPGQEQFFIEKEGAVAHRQVLDLPRPEGRRRPPTVPVVIGLAAIVVVAVVGAFVSGAFSGGESEPARITSPITAPASATATQIPGATAVPLVISPVAGTATSSPAEAQSPAATTVPVAAFIPAAFLRAWGSQGNGDGQLDSPTGVAVDGAGNVYLADKGNLRVQKFSADGRFLLTWGSKGSGDGQFNSVNGVALDGAGNVYVTGDHRVQKFNGDGRFLLKWGSGGSGDGQFASPQGIAVDRAGNVYVADQVGPVQKFSSGGWFLAKWGSELSDDGKFRFPVGIAVDGAGNVYVADKFNDRIEKFSTDGRFLHGWGSSGSGDGQFDSPTGLAVDGAGNVYVHDFGNHRVQVFDSTGQFLFKWGSQGGGASQFAGPGIAVDGAGNVYVADVGNNRVQVFGPPLQPSPSAQAPIPTTSPASAPSAGTFEELSKVENELVGLWELRQAATKTRNCRTRFTPTGSVYECSSESNNDGINFHMIFNADRTGCRWKKPDGGGPQDYQNFSDWEIGHPELTPFRVEAVPRGFEYDQSKRRVWPKDFPRLKYGPSSTTNLNCRD
jgi:sugar lactone lactonase YvrE